MNRMNQLANQHILEWEARIERIDAMAARAHTLHGQEPEGSELHSKLADIKMYREQLSLDLVGAQNHPESGVQSALEATGQQLERILGSVLGVEVPRRRKMDRTDQA